MTTTYASHFSTRSTPQSEAIPGKTMVQNSAGGFSFAVDDWTRLERFLILGSEGGSYYATERGLTIENAQCVMRCVAVDPMRTVQTIVEISEAGRAPKNDPAVFALAICAGAPDNPGARMLALAALPKVCRIGTHLFQFAEAVEKFRGWGRSLRNAVGQWYKVREPGDLAYQVSKYQQRNGWSHRDLLRLSHPKPATEEYKSVYRWACGKPVETPVPLLAAVDAAKAAGSASEIVSLIREHGLVRECIPTQWLDSPDVWDALLEKMPLTAMIRNLATMTKIGLIKPLSSAVAKVCDRLADGEYLRKSRVHPLAILLAQRTYASGRGLRGSSTWSPVPQVVDALDGAFYAAFQNVEPTGKRWLLGVDVSGSMSAQLSGTPISCAEAAAAMALVTAHTEPAYYIHGFSGQFVDLGLSKGMRLNDALRRTQGRNFGSTDCAIPMLYALNNRLDVDTFVVLTDSETWCGSIHPSQALRQYREKMGIPAKLIVMGMVSNGFTIADPADSGMLDVVGFDSAVPQIMADFAR